MIVTADHDGIAILTLNNGPVNALDLELLSAVPQSLAAVADSRAVVLTGSGRSFSAGVDLRQIIDGGPPYVEKFLPALSLAMLTLFEHPKPVVYAGYFAAGDDDLSRAIWPSSASSPSSAARPPRPGSCTCEPRGVALALEGLAGAIGLSGDFETSARLLGASESVRRAASMPSAPSEQAETDRIAAAARVALGEAAFGTAYQHGSAQTPEDATALL